jgi:hypothetical protein
MWWKLQAPQAGVVWAASSCSLLYVDLGSRDPRALQPALAQHRFHLRAAAAGAFLFHEGSFVGPFVYGDH